MAIQSWRSEVKLQIPGAKATAWAGPVSPGGSGGGSPSLASLASSGHLHSLALVPLSTSKACLPLSICTLDHLLPICSHNPPPTSAYNDPSDSVKAHLVKPGPSLHPRVFLQIPSSKSLLLYWVPFTGPRIGTWISLEAIIPPPTRCTKRRRPIAPGGSLTPNDFCPG